MSRSKAKIIVSNDCATLLIESGLWRIKSYLHLRDFDKNCVF
jgi:hypothetical protein